MNREEWLKSIKVGDKVVLVNHPIMFRITLGTVKSISEQKFCIQLEKTEDTITFYDRITGARGKQGESSWINPYKDF